MRGGRYPPQGRHSAHHQVCAGLRRVVDENVEPGFEARTYHQAIFARELPNGRPERIEDRRHHGSHNAPLNVLGANAEQIQHRFQLRAVLIGSLDVICDNSGLKENFLFFDCSQNNVGISNIHC